MSMKRERRRRIVIVSHNEIEIKEVGLLSYKHCQLGINKAHFQNTTNNSGSFDSFMNNTHKSKTQVRQEVFFMAQVQKPIP